MYLLSTRQENYRCVLWHQMGSSNNGIMGFNSPTVNPFIQLAFEGCRWLCKKETSKKEPVTSEMMKKIVERFCKHNSDLDELLFFITWL